MIDDSFVWGGFAWGASYGEVHESLKGSIALEGGITFSTVKFGCDFEAVFRFDELGLTSVSVALVRMRPGIKFSRIRREVVGSISANHGRGDSRILLQNEHRKRWRDNNVIVNLLAIDDLQFPVLSVDWSKGSTTDAELWAYKNR